ncbi:hypothetical protein COF68_05335 [Bacillus toyonensis]|uniref:hypothetical protein n=1 Tax=Bacillus toyonensis TaxID=155322 RepID=UPI000BFEA4C9|nr:hypothetical protein [Bacillus toyonensis]PHE64266.1 hypothetical protein COF68_05335 [Bacillus toyonensis]
MERVKNIKRKHAKHVNQGDSVIVLDRVDYLHLINKVEVLDSILTKMKKERTLQEHYRKQELLHPSAEG